jgi:hypothetical protein
MRETAQTHVGRLGYGVLKPLLVELTTLDRDVPAASPRKHNP